MEIKIFPSSEEVARQGAMLIAELIRESIAKKGSFVWAVSGGRTPWEMIRFLAQENLPWEKVFLFQVDERVAPDGHKDRNLTQLFQTLQGTRLMTRLNIFPMPINAEEIDQACDEYAAHIHRVTGGGQFDLVHLGLGSDGHTASLIPNDPVCEVLDRNVAMTENPYQERIRMTLTYPLINKAHKILWLATGAEKSIMLKRLFDSDPAIPAGRISQDQALIFADESAATALEK